MNPEGNNPPSPEKVGHTTGVYVQYSSQYTVVWVLLDRTMQVPDKSCRTYGFYSLSEKTTKSKRFQMSLRRQHFLLSYFKEPECWSGRGLNSQPPAQQTGTLPTELTRRRRLKKLGTLLPYYGNPD